MPDEDDNDDDDVRDPNARAINGIVRGTTTVDGSTRKRRLSKRERKNLKRKTPARAIDASLLLSSSSSSSSSSSPSRTTDEDHRGGEWTLEDYMADYVPTPKPSRREGGDDDNNNNNNNDHGDGDNDFDASNSKSLGKWFPSASVIKSSVCYSNDYLAKLAKARRSRTKDDKVVTKENGGEVDEEEEEEEEPRASLVLFYQYVSPPWSAAKVNALITYLTNVAGNRTNIGGRIRVSSEGVNATVSAASSCVQPENDENVDENKNHEWAYRRTASFRASRTLRHFAEDLRRFDPSSFVSTDFKYVDGLTADRHFKELKLIPVKELVFYGLREGDCGGIDAVGGSGTARGGGGVGGGGGCGGGVHLDPHDYHEMLKRDDAVVIDVRNHYEAAIGRFEGQMMGEGANGGGDDDDLNAKGGGARYIDPRMRKSTDFTSWLTEPETKEKLEGKTVLMFCTGGIRCERASAYLNSQMGSDVKGVYQLQGGVERYLQSFPDGGFWRGKNFVFDKREAIGPGNVNGDGLSSAATRSTGKNGKEDGKLLSWGTECARCHRPWDRYIGKRKCYTCGVPVLVCDSCMSRSCSQKKGRKKNKNSTEKKDGEEEAGDKVVANGKVEEDDKSSKEGSERIRCPLCIEEGVTVPAEEVEYTHNGVRGKLRSSSFDEGAGFDEGFGTTTCKIKNAKDDAHKAARSVLKWGGGHASRKKEKRRFSRRPCQFGADCARRDCFFYHPER